MDKLEFETPDMVTENIDKIAALFPTAITEMRGEDGEIKRGVNFEVLKQILSWDVVDGDECYEFTWVGKKAAMAEAARLITKTLRPVKADSRDWDTTENLYIEGDNLEVLKILQESYLGKVKMIYIDPPYNTGNDFIYADDFMRTQREEDSEMGIIDENDNYLVKNTDANGKFHSDWCSMIFSRLVLARNLLTEDGIIFISIDDNEVFNLKEICDEVFGSLNFLNHFAWVSNITGRQISGRGAAKTWESVLVYEGEGDLMKLQFKHQPFQAEAADAVCDVFCGQPYRTVTYRRDLGDLTGVQISTYDTEVGFRNQPLVPDLTNRRLLDNLRAVQRRNGLKPSDELTGPGVNLSIEMETGTGKTYTYVKTMYELNKRYGWSKFIIVVPSVAIREGVYKSLQTTQEHFAGEYNKKIRFFIYNSGRLTEVDRFASDSAINVMIINMQAFNSSKNQRIIDKKLDTFRSRKPIDIIAKTNPILIIDEPQSVEGKQTKESLKKFQPLFTLRYSATHKEKYDMVYRLDALDAYNQHLVKKIAALGVTLEGSTATNGYVYCEGIDLYKDKAPTARLGFEVKGKTGTRTVVKKVYGGDDLYDLSNGLAEYADRYRILPNGIDGRDNSVTFLNGLKIYAGQICGNEQLVSLQRRIQIRETIRTHIQRERELYPRGIKVLSLFFIDEVSKYRSYDGDDDAGRNGENAQMFEEEYENVVGNLQREFGDDAYMEYLNKINPHRTHQGYFSIDKKKGKKARFVESKVDRKTQLSDDAEAYDLIMKDKERLLSMDEPVRFIFSHSALREGWDNPNVFQICTLKKQSDSDIRSRQPAMDLSRDKNAEKMN